MNAPLTRELRLALEIADDAVVVALMSHCGRVISGSETWIDLEKQDPDIDLSSDLEYANLRGLIRKHPQKANLIQTLEP